MSTTGNQGVLNPGELRVELRLVDILLLASLGLLIMIEVIFRARVEGWMRLVLINGLLLVLFPSTLIFRSAGSPAFRAIARIAVCMGITSLIYNQMGRLIHSIFPFWLDSLIDTFEVGVFGIRPNVWISRFASATLTDVMMYAYVGYVPLIPLVAYYCYRSAGNRALEEYLGAITLTFLICYFLYILLPVAGPSRFLAPIDLRPDPASAISMAVEYMKSNVHLPGGAFPSAHCAATAVMCAFLFRHSRAWGALFLPVAALIYISTVYGTFHYVVDVIAGTLIAVAGITAAPRLQARMGVIMVRLGFSVDPGDHHAIPETQPGELS
jgi:membrane-associated phospholipid phosphatase